MGIEQFLLERAEKKGEKRGENKDKKEVIRNARLKGLSIELIADIVNLPTEKVRQILDKMGIE